MSRSISFLSIFLLSLLPLARLQGAADRAMIDGRVIDTSGAAVVGAAVTLHQAAGSVVFRAISNDQGEFFFTGIPAGSYLADASGPGLTTERAVNLQLVPGEAAQLSLTLAVSSVTAQVTITAAGAPQSIDETSKALSVVDSAAAEQRGLFMLTDALRFVPGLIVSTRGGPGNYTEIQTRGLPTQYTAVLIDGAPVRDPTSPRDDASALLSQLYLPDTSRIEVLRGSGSSLYGSNAVSGAVNILTNGGGGPFHGDVDVQGGGLGLFEGAARVAGGFGSNRLTYTASAVHLGETQGVDGVEAARAWSGQGGIQYEFSPTIHVAVDLLGTNSFVQPSVTPSALSTANGVVAAIPVPANQLALADAGLAYNPANATFLPSLGDPDFGVYAHFLDSLFRFDQELTPSLSYRISYSQLTTERDTTDGPGGPMTASYFPPTYNTSDDYQGVVDEFRARVSYAAGAHNILSAGYEWTREHYLETASDQDPNPSTHVYDQTHARQDFNSVYGQDEIRLANSRLQILLSGRFTGVSLAQPSIVGGNSPYAGVKLPGPPSAWTGDASAAYFFAASGTKVRAHAGNSFRMPSLYERFGGYFYGGAYYPLGDPNLSPERAVSGDFGFDQYFFGERVRLGATYFYSRLQQVVGFEAFPPAYVDAYGRSSGYFNTGGGISRGVETTLEVRPSRNTLIQGSYTFVNAKDLTSEFYTGTAAAPLQMPRVMPNQVKVVATQELGKRIDLALDFEGGSDYLFPLFGYDYTASNAYLFRGPRQLGLSAGYTQPLRDRMSLRFYTRVSNALNQDYYQDGFRTPGIWAVGGVHLSF